jgi:Rod binding domain-containing protein
VVCPIKELMSKHLNDLELKSYIEKSLPSDKLIEVDSHLSSCDPCFASLKNTARLPIGSDQLLTLEKIEPFDHLLFEDLTAYVDNRLTEIDQEIIESHLTSCDSCNEEVEELQSFRSLIEARTTPIKQHELVKSRFFSRILNRGFALQFASLVLISGIAVLLVTQLQKTRQRSSERAAFREASSPLPQSNSQSSPEVAQKETLIASNNAISNESAGIEVLQGSSHRIVSEAVLSGRVQKPAILQELKGETEVLLDDSSKVSSFSLTGPVSEVVLSTTPVLKWNRLEGASFYEVTILNRDTNEVLRSGPLKGTQWNTGPLKRGSVYSWQVTADKDGDKVISPAPPSPEARFKVVGNKSASEIHSLKQKSSSHLTLGAYYAKEGLIREAQRHLRLHLQSYPQSSQARKLLADIKRW